MGVQKNAAGERGEKGKLQNPKRRGEEGGGGERKRERGNTTLFYILMINNRFKAQIIGL